jgi:hypothetical protein
MSSGGSFFNRFPPWGGGGSSGGQHGGGQHGPGRGGNHPKRHPHGPGGSRGHVTFEDKGDYDFADDGRDYSGGRYSIRLSLSDSEYEARRNAIFQPEGAPLAGDTAGEHHAGGRGGGQPMPPPPPAWQGQQGAGLLPPTAPLQDPQGQQGLLLVPIPLGGGATNPPAMPAHQAPTAQQQGGAQIAVQPPSGHGGAGAGLPQAPAGRGANGNPPKTILASLSPLSALPLS